MLDRDFLGCKGRVFQHRKKRKLGNFGDVEKVGVKMKDEK
jgi:hypothetical protein